MNDRSTDYEELEKFINYSRSRTHSVNNTPRIISLGVPRGIGKTSYFAENARLKDFIIVKNDTIIREFKSNYGIDSNKIIRLDQIERLIGKRPALEFTVFGDELTYHERYHVLESFTKMFYHCRIEYVFLHTGL